MEYLLLWAIFPILSSIIAFSKNRDAKGWFFIGIFLGPLAVVVAFLSKLDRTAFVEKRLDDLESYIKQDMALKYITERLSLRKAEVEQACLILLEEGRITENNCIKVLGGIPYSREKDLFMRKALKRNLSFVATKGRM